jgi:hypothetical protein
MKKWSCCLVAVCVANLFAGVKGWAQFPGGGQPGLNAAMLQIFGDIPGFSSKADVRLMEKGEKTPTTMTMNFSMLDGNARVDLDMATVRSRQMTPQMLTSFKQAGLDRLVTIIRPDRKTATLIYPVVQSFVVMPMTKEEAADMQRRYQIEKSRLSKETIEGHPTEKCRVTLRAESGEKQQATVWYATDLGNFPLKVEMNQPDATLTMSYKEVKLGRPDAKEFDAPAGYTRHKNIELLMQAAMLRALSEKK